MIHPSYNELLKTINQNNGDEEYPVINSRYSIVMAAAKRARQLIDDEEPLVSKAPVNKPLSIAVEELRRGKIKITEEGVDDFQFHLRNSDNSASDIAYDEETENSDQEGDASESEDEEEDEELNEEDGGNDGLMEQDDDDAE